MSYSISVVIESNAETIFQAITKHVQQWWGNTDKAVSNVDDEFITSFDKTFWKFKISQYEQNHKIIWDCIEAQHIHIGKGGVWYDGIEKEWIGTKVEWNLEEKSQNETTLYFKHNGLVPELNCYEICWPAWERFVTQSLKSFVETGKGMPHIS